MTDAAVIPAAYVKPRYRHRTSKAAGRVPVGAKFGMLTVRSEPYRDRRTLRVACQCDCGGQSTPSVYNLLNGTTGSCGCQKTTAMLRAPQPNRQFAPRTPEAARKALEVNSIPEPNSGCLLWLGQLDTDGYGRARYQAKEIKAHRLSFRMFCDDLPDGQPLLHSCDTRCCINPEHVAPGTAAENSAQMVARGRSYRPSGDKHYTARIGPVNTGEKNPMSKLTWDDVAAIRAAPETHVVLAQRYGVSTSNISMIKHGISWRQP